MEIVAEIHHNPNKYELKRVNRKQSTCISKANGDKDFFYYGNNLRLNILVNVFSQQKTNL